MLTIAHLSDVHLAPLPRLPLGYANMKRALGYLNWQRKRRAVHRLEVVDALVEDLLRQRPDHIAVTGDLVNIGLPEEYVGAAAWLQRLGPPELISVVPGNHDIYTRLGGERGVGRWQAYMQSDLWGSAMTSSWEGYPYVRRVGETALIGLCSAVPTPPFVAAGRLGGEQLSRLPALLDACRNAGLLRLVLIHHPPFPGQASRMRGLADAADLQQVIARHGAEIVLHGHNHLNMEGRTAWGHGVAVAIGVPSFSAAKMHHAEPLGRYNLIRVHPATETGARLELIGRGITAAGLDVVEIERRWIDIADGLTKSSTQI